MLWVLMICQTLYQTLCMHRVILFLELTYLVAEATQWLSNSPRFTQLVCIRVQVRDPVCFPDMEVCINYPKKLANMLILTPWVWDSVFLATFWWSQCSLLVHGPQFEDQILPFTVICYGSFKCSFFLFSWWKFIWKSMFKDSFVFSSSQRWTSSRLKLWDNNNSDKA